MVVMVLIIFVVYDNYNHRKCLEVNQNFMQKGLKIEPHNNLANIFSCIAVLQVEHFQGEVAAQTNCNGFGKSVQNFVEYYG